MLISHEVPISILQQSKKFNDYDYCLLHLTYTHPEYRQFYLDSIKEGRKVLLDNSLFELGDALTNEQLAAGVLDIHPTWYVIPDCLNQTNITMDRFESFIKAFSDLPGLKIGVVQGSTDEELFECYRFMSDKADKIAIPFDSVGFNYFDESIDNLELWCNGRQAFIKALIEKGLWNTRKPHHLLGCSYAKEFQAYHNIKEIESVDTSSPVVCGIKGVLYEENGNKTKPSIKLCDLIDHTVNKDEYSAIMYNTCKFRSLCNE